ncbi:MAG: hypothetical protein EYC70_05490 [Planctomycetota bacterium]|nr:MAG: hypothetical protein EYC70_05490 [Planctomycetota bacterium]
MNLHPFSLFAGGSLAVIALLALGQASAAPAQGGAAPAPKWEYKVVEDLTEGQAAKLAADGWEYAGYLGNSVKGVSNDETLWKRPGK